MWEKFRIIVSELGIWSVNQVIFSYYLNNNILQKKWIWSNIQILFWFLQPSCRCQGSSGNWIWHGIDWCQSFNYITQWRIYNDQGWWLVWSHGQWRGSCHAPVWQKSISTAQVSVLAENNPFMYSKVFLLEILFQYKFRFFKAYLPLLRFWALLIVALRRTV